VRAQLILSRNAVGVLREDVSGDGEANPQSGDGHLTVLGRVGVVSESEQDNRFATFEVVSTVLTGGRKLTSVRILHCAIKAVALLEV